MKRRTFVTIGMMACLLIGVFSSCGGTKVTRTPADEVTDLSGRWNETDSRLTAEAMLQDALNRPWLTRFTGKHNKPPVVIVGVIRNKSSEHIATDTFIKDIERELINDGRVEMVASSDQRIDLVAERERGGTFSSAETVKQLMEETGADYMLYGTINSIVDRLDGRETKFFQVDLELLDIETNKKVWIGNKKIKKDINRSKRDW